MGTVFQGGHFISFKEFECFTNPIILNRSFVNIIIDGTMIWPGNLTGTDLSYATSGFQCNKIIISEGFSGTFHWTFFYYAVVNYIVFPSTIPIIPNVSAAGFNRTLKIIINGNNVIQTGSHSYYRSTYNIFFYVPDSLVEAYRADETWQTYFNTDKILPISEYTE